MIEFKLVINDVKDGKSYQKVISGQECELLIGKKIGGKINGDFLGFDGYEFEIRGGSDDAGFPMRFDVEGIGRKRPYVSRGPGVRGLKSGQKARKSVIGNIISNSLHQINLKITKYGNKSVKEILGINPKEEPPKEEKKEPIEEKVEMR